jgi:hypothetical protein
MIALSPVSTDSRASTTPPERQPLRRQLGTQHANSLLARLDAMKQKWASPIPEEEDAILTRTETPPLQPPAMDTSEGGGDGAGGSAFSAVPSAAEGSGEGMGEERGGNMDHETANQLPFTTQQPEVAGTIVFCGNRAFPPSLTVHLGPNNAPIVLDFSLRPLADYTALCKEFNVTMNFADASLESSGMGSQVILECCIKRVLGCEAGEQAFETPVLGPKDHYTWTVAAAGEYDVHDATFPFNKATVHVRDFPSPPRSSPLLSSSLLSSSRTMRRKPVHPRAAITSPPSTPACLPVVDLPLTTPLVLTREVEEALCRGKVECVPVVEKGVGSNVTAVQPALVPGTQAPTFSFAWQCTLVEWLLYLLSPILLSPAPLSSSPLLNYPPTDTNISATGPAPPSTAVFVPVKTHALRSVNEQLEAEGFPLILLSPPLCYALLQHYHVSARIASGVAVYSVALRGTDYRLRRVCGLYSSLSRPLLHDLSMLANNIARQTPEQWPRLY